ncbi:MAG: metallo-peptidase family Reprolysin-like protein [Flavipsychrobacter sp.]|nr:metallo-peptidase family Reprolysin-like protein [Flavipsychrobacter sp.]
MKTFTKILLFSLFIASTAQAQYCTLPGRTPYAAEQPGIQIFKLGTINRTSSNVEDMSKVLVVTTDSTNLFRGHTYTVTIKHNRDSIFFPTARNNIRVWIDYNNNYNFDDAGETVITADFQAPGYYTGNFTVPVTAPVGTVRLRATAKMSSDAGHITPSSCDSPTIDPIGYHGEMEDYKVKIMPTTGVDEVVGITNDIVVYPCPTPGRITVSFAAIKSEPVSIDLLDVAGKLVGSLLQQTQSLSSYDFDLNDYVSAPGIYMIKVTTADNVSYQKVVKTN